MITLNYENLTKITSSHGLSSEKISEKGPNLQKFLKAIKEKNQGFYSVIDDKEPIKKIEKIAEEFIKKIKKEEYWHVVVLGIGGSALGTICLHEALKHLFENQLHYTAPHLRVIDNIDPDLIAETEKAISYENTLFIVVTKSGSTPETLSQYFYFRKKCDNKNLDPKKHFVFITDPQKGFLRKIANKEGITTFDIPKNVGGRFSVLTPVGLLPAALKGINIESLIKGAKKGRDTFLESNSAKNTAFQLATIQYLLSQKNKPINVMMPYSQKLFRFADWYRQLLAESIGKKGKGITPINALGVTDQHSQLQLYQDGPNDKLFIFLEIEKFQNTVGIPGDPVNPGKNLNKNTGLTFNHLIKTEKQATEQSLTKSDRPCITIHVDSITEESLGELFLILEGSIAFLGEFFKINAFDQPGVELSKKLTKQLL